MAEFLTEVEIAAALMGAQTFIEKSIPAITQRPAKRRAEKIAAATAEQPDMVAAVVDAHTSVDDIGAEVFETGTEIDTQQWYQLFFEAAVHGAGGSVHQPSSAERWAFLASAQIVDDEETQDLASAMRELALEQLRARLDRALKQHPELAAHGLSHLDALDLWQRWERETAINIAGGELSRGFAYNPDNIPAFRRECGEF